MSKHEYVEIVDRKTDKVTRRLNLSYLTANGKAFVVNSVTHEGLLVRKKISDVELETGCLI